MKEDRLSKSLSGIAGVYFATAELSRRGFIATPGETHFGLPNNRRSLEHFLQESHVEGGLVAFALDAVLAGVPLEQAKSEAAQ
jgi:hypothetical protein